MAIAKITGQGLKTIALLIAFLWACIIGERLMLKNAQQQCAEVLRDLHQMQRKRTVEPVSVPRAPRSRSDKPALG